MGELLLTGKRGHGVLDASGASADRGQRRSTHGGRISLSRRLTLAFGLLVALVLVAGGFSYDIASRQALSVGRLSQHLLPMLATNQQLRLAVLSAEGALDSYHLTGHADDLASYQDASRQCPVLLERLRAQAVVREERTAVSQEAAATQAWQQISAERADVPVGAIQAELLDAGEDAPLDAFRAANAALTSYLQQQAALSDERGRTQLRQAQWALSTIPLVAAAVAFVVGTATHRGMVGPLRLLEDAVTRRPADSRQRVPVIGPPEVRTLAIALNEAADASDALHAEQDRINQELQALDRARQTLLANISHELRTPLTNISGYLELLQDQRDDLTAHQASVVDTIARNSTRLASLVDNVLTLSAVEVGAFHSVLIPVDLATVVTDVTADLQPAADKAGVALSAETPSQALTVAGDRDQIYRLVTNLVANAVKFTPVGGQVRVHARRCQDDGQDTAELVVSDTGIGIPEDDQAHLFTRFYRAPNATDQHVQGTGLGLAIVDAIVTNHQGHIDLTSTEGRGTTITVHLPTADSARNVTPRR